MGTQNLTANWDVLTTTYATMQNFIEIKNHGNLLYVCMYVLYVTVLNNSEHLRNALTSNYAKFHRN